MDSTRTRALSLAGTTLEDRTARAYPPELRRREHALVARRRRAATVDPAAPPREGAAVDPASIVGVGVSGGGIRSATFALGVFQSLARERLVRRIDVLSTVSGGGYFGSFLGRLLTRPAVADVAAAEEVLTGTHAAIGDRVVDRLRENGRYLSPNGSGDLLVGGAVLLRNWVALHVVLGCALLGVLTLLQVVRIGAVALGAPPAAFGIERGWLWASPLLWAPAAWLALVCVPLGWAYWFLETRVLLRVLGLAVVLGAAVASGLARGAGVVAVEHGVVVCVLAAVAASRLGLRKARALQRGPRVPLALARSVVSRWLARALGVFGVLLLIGAVDAVGGSLVRAADAEGASTFGVVWAATGTAFLALSGLGRRIAVMLGGRPGSAGRRVSLPAVASVAAAAACAFLFVTADVLSHRIAATARSGTSIGLPARTYAEGSAPRRVVLDGPNDSVSLEIGASSPRAAAKRASVHVEGRDVVPSAVAFGLLLALSWVFGRTWTFLNRSSHHALYSARIGRAYLGASNPERWRDGLSVTELRPDDDISLAAYYATPGAATQGSAPQGATTQGAAAPDAAPKAASVIEKGGPLHLVNITLNETTEGTSNVAQQDRHGTSFAVGPCGLSVGVADHAVLDWRAPREATILPLPSPDGAGGSAADRDASMRAFGDALDLGSGPDVLPLSEWVGASGAAFSTGLGARTRVGTSLLCGLANVRLGHWWWSGVRRRSAAAAARQHGGSLRRGFGVQAYLLDELTAQFPGAARHRWYLSDGGHFENLGAYELLRRGIRRIVVLDAEADPEYGFDGLANLVRKARIDFGAEVRFRDARQLEATVAPALRAFVGPLEDLAPGSKPSVRPADPRVLSTAHAALADVVYADGTQGVLLYVKATVREGVPLDVLNYRGTHPDFPHETTADQFFDEAQWESYRRLGEHIGRALFEPRDPAPAAGPAWCPRDLFA
ncbi:MAG: hypothetical protein IT460_06365 [Planctomycetes bacterium]|nr:hypothetical protein [Planctomycetota bacterium]